MKKEKLTYVWRVLLLLLFAVSCFIYIYCTVKMKCVQVGYPQSEIYCTEHLFCFILDSHPTFMKLLFPQLPSQTSTLPWFGSISAGFPSPADDFLENPIDLHAYLIRNKPSTFFVRVEGTALLESHICDQDLLVVDTSLQPRHKNIVVACSGGELLVRHFIVEAGKKLLRADDRYIADIQIFETEFSLFGVVTGIIRKLN